MPAKGRRLETPKKKLEKLLYREAEEEAVFFKHEKGQKKSTTLLSKFSF